MAYGKNIILLFIFALSFNKFLWKTPYLFLYKKLYVSSMRYKYSQNENISIKLFME